MKLPPFLLDQWLTSHEFSTPPIQYNLGSSTGPRWTLEELQRLPRGELDLTRMEIGYAPPMGSAEMRNAIAGYHGVDPDWVISTTGASEALSILLCLASEPSANVVLPEPAFTSFTTMARAWQLEVSPYVLKRDAAYAYSAQTVLDAVNDKTVLALVNSPHNPTGSILERSEIERLAATLAERHVPLIVDEVYHSLYFDKDRSSAAGIRNVIVINDMSKALSLPGLRTGWIIDADPERRKRIVDARSYFTISGSPLSNTIAAHALRNHDTVLERAKRVLSENLAKLTRVMEETSNFLSWITPKGGTTAYPWFRDGRDSRPFCERLAKAGVLIVPGDCFGNPDHVRIGISKETDGFDVAMAVLSNELGNSGDT